MRLKIIFVLMLTLVFSATSFAQKTVKHPIDIAEDNCLKGKYSTRQTAECLSRSYDAWEADISKTYAEIKRQITPTASLALENSQKAWEDYRDHEFEFFSDLYEKQRGTLYTSVRIIKRVNILKARALELENILQIVKRLNGET